MAMSAFSFHNPTRIEFGVGSIARLAELVPTSRPILLLYGQGSIKRNGVHQQVIQALGSRTVVEFGGIEPNPLHETCLQALALVREHQVGFILAVGGGSVADAAKYIAAGACLNGGDPWNILTGQTPVSAAVPLGVVLTLPATGSEANGNSVISRAATREKLYFGSPLVYPVFAVLDPETTASLPQRQVANGVVDAFVHTTEQYLTYPVDAKLQDRQAEGILLTLIEEGPVAVAGRADAGVRANLMWTATQALNGLIGCGVPQDWATHMIGHELTALYGLDHAQSLAVVLPGVLAHQLTRKQAKLAQYGRRVWNLTARTESALAREAIDATVNFFRELGVGTTGKDYGIPPDAPALVARRLAQRKGEELKLGEHRDLHEAAVREILELRLG